MTARADVAAGLRDGTPQYLRVRLLHAEGVLAADRGKARVSPSASSSSRDRPSSLLVQTAKRQPSRGQPVERRIKARKRPRAVGDMGGVVRDEIGEQPVELGASGVRPSRRRARARSSPGAAADHVAGRRIGDRRQAFARNTTLRVSIRSGAVSISVPSRSKTTVRAGMIFRLSWRAGTRLDRAYQPRSNDAHVLMDIEAQKRQAAAVAVDGCGPGMRLGLGTGSTAKHFVELLAERVRAGLDVVGVPTSEATRARPQRLGVPLTTLDETPELDLTVDGADEIAPDLSLIKGGGGALLREKIVAAASARMVVIADESKWVPALGRFPLPIEVVPFGLAATRRAVEAAAAAAGCPGRATLRAARTASFRHRRRPLDPRCRSGPHRRSGGLAGRLVAIPGRGRARSLYRTGASRHTRRTRRRSRRRTALNAEQFELKRSESP